MGRTCAWLYGEAFASACEADRDFSERMLKMRTLWAPAGFFMIFCLYFFQRKAWSVELGIGENELPPASRAMDPHTCQ